MNEVKHNAAREVFEGAFVVCGGLNSDNKLSSVELMMVFLKLGHQCQVWMKKEAGTD